MAKFRFTQEKPITIWIRDYYEVEAETLECAISIVEEADCSLDELDYEDDRVNWVERDTEDLENWSYKENCFPTSYVVKSCDTDDEILSR